MQISGEACMLCAVSDLFMQPGMMSVVDLLKWNALRQSALPFIGHYPRLFEQIPENH